MNRKLIAAVVAGVALVGGLAFAGSELADHRTERARQFISWKLDDALDDIDANDAQRQTAVQLKDQLFDDGVKPENSYRVTLERGRLTWTTSDGGTVRVYTKEPETSWWRRFQADALGLLPIHSIL